MPVRSRALPDLIDTKPADDAHAQNSTDLQFDQRLSWCSPTLLPRSRLPSRSHSLDGHASRPPKNRDAHFSVIAFHHNRRLPCGHGSRRLSRPTQANPTPCLEPGRGV